MLLVYGGDDVGVMQGIEITHLRDGDGTMDAEARVDWSALASDLVTETVVYTDGDRSERSRRAMKAAALAHASIFNCGVSASGSLGHWWFQSSCTSTGSTYLLPTTTKKFVFVVASGFAIRTGCNISFHMLEYPAKAGGK